MKKTLALLLMGMLLLPLLAACTQAPTADPTPAPTDTGDWQKMSTNFFGTFDTMVTVIGYVQEEETFSEIVQEIYAQFLRYHQAYDGYNAYEGINNVYVLNRDGGKGPVQVAPELMDLLLYCKEKQPLTKGTVNIALGSVLNLWHIYRDRGEGDPEGAELPPMDKLQSAAQHVNFDDIIIDEAAGTVHFADPDLKIDVGAVAKGYATEQVAHWLAESEMSSYLLSAGGNVRVGDAPKDGRARWVVSVQDPDGSVLTSPEEDILDKLYVVNESVVTSGDYQRYYVVDGVRYHHLIDPTTLMPADMFRSVTVVCEDSGWADILSTAFFMMSYEEGKAFAATLEGVEVMWVLADDANTIHMTDGLAAMAASQGVTQESLLNN